MVNSSVICDSKLLFVLLWCCVGRISLMLFMLSMLIMMSCLLSVRICNLVVFCYIFVVPCWSMMKIVISKILCVTDRSVCVRSVCVYGGMFCDCWRSCIYEFQIISNLDQILMEGPKYFKIVWTGVKFRCVFWSLVDNQS